MIVTQRRIQSTAPDLAVLLGGSQGDIQNHGMRPKEVPLGGAPLLPPLPAAVSLGPFPRLRGKVRMGASAAQRQQLMQYHFEYSRSFFEYLIVPESHNAISLDVDTRVAAGVARGPAPDADHHQAQSPALRPGTRNPPHTHRPEPAGESGNRSIAGAANAATAVARRQWIDCAVCGHGTCVSLSRNRRPLLRFQCSLVPRCTMDSYTTLLPPLPPSRPSPASGGRGQ